MQWRCLELLSKEWVCHCKMCRKYEKHFQMFLYSNNATEEKSCYKYEKKGKCQKHITREISASLQRSIQRAKRISNELDIQRRYVRYKNI